MRSLKITTVAILIVVSGSLFGQQQAEAALEQKAPMDLRQKAELAAHEIEKICGVDGKDDINNLGKACYEHELALSMDGVQGNEQKTAAIEEEFDQAVKAIIGSQKMAAFQDWKSKPKAYETEDYK